VVKKKSLFDDKPVEIQELTFVIKEDINRLNGSIKGLEQYLNQRSVDVGNRQTQEHSSNIVVSLQSRLAGASMNLKDLLEIRSEVFRIQYLSYVCHLKQLSNRRI
jgi:syntaxin 5